MDEGFRAQISLLKVHFFLYKLKLPNFSNAESKETFLSYLVCGMDTHDAVLKGAAGSTPKDTLLMKKQGFLYRSIFAS